MRLRRVIVSVLMIVDPPLKNARQITSRRALPRRVRISLGGRCRFRRFADKLRGGEVPEWPNGLDSKSSVRLYRTVGSNPTLSASVQ